MMACHHLPGWQLGAPSGGPRMSPRPCVAKYGATHSANHLPGLEITSPFVIIRYKRSIDDGIQTQTRLRRTWRSAAPALRRWRRLPQRG